MVASKGLALESTVNQNLDRTNAQAGKYAKACLSVAKELNVKCIDLYHLMQSEKGNKEDEVS
jgi:hypothetical protein